MFKAQPKGLIAASLANMGERFGFYTMMAILVLFLQAKFGLSESTAGIIYATFYSSIYFLAIAGGVIADKTKNYKGTILVGLLMMAGGYAIIAVPTPTPVSSVPLLLTLTCIGLAIIAFGNGLFKGNLQALVGQMYDNPKYDKVRDSGFSLFYMFINIGGIFAPMIAPSMRSWWLGRSGFTYDAALPELCHQHLGNTLTPQASERFQSLASEVSTNPITDFTAFSNVLFLKIYTANNGAISIGIILELTARPSNTAEYKGFLVKSV